MLGFVKQIRNRCDVILQFKPQDYLLYTLLEDIYEDAQAVATGYSAMTEDNGMEFCVRCNLQHPKGTDCPYFKGTISGVIVQSHKRPDMIIEDIGCSDTDCFCHLGGFNDTDCTGDE